MDDVSSAPLSAALKELLYRARLTSSRQLRPLAVADLARALRIPLDDAAVYRQDLEACFGWAAPRGAGIHAATGHSALELLEEVRAGAATIHAQPLLQARNLAHAVASSVVVVVACCPCSARRPCIPPAW